MLADAARAGSALAGIPALVVWGLLAGCVLLAGPSLAGPSLAGPSLAGAMQTRGMHTPAASTAGPTVGPTVEATPASPADTTDAPDAQADSGAVSPMAPVALPNVVVTATKTATDPAHVPVPTDVVDAAAIQSRGAVRLADLLATQSGLTLTHDHGTGLQMQGLDSEYTLILVDGQPLVGRTAGTLDLRRVSVRGVERVEIVRGPSSSLYGSEALAGVVNVITAPVDERFGGDVHARYGTHGTTDVGARVEAARGPVGVAASLQRYASAGYDLTAETTAPTVPTFADYSARTRVSVDAGASTDVFLRLRGTHQQQSSVVDVAGHEQTFDDDARRMDWSVAPELVHTVRPGVRLTARLYGSGYHTRTTLDGRRDGTRLETSTYDQHVRRVEVEAQIAASSRHLVTAGGGGIRETVDADRVVGARTGGFVFVQDEWTPADRLRLVPSLRLDAHSDYATRLSPKLAALVRVSEGLRVRASVGSGYKAPAFRQLYLDFTNPQAGYTVFGAEGVRAGLQRLDAQGEIQTYLQDPSTLGGPVEAERSVAFNAGVDADVPGGLSVRVNVFHNELTDLIDTQPVATKTNGQQVFTYFNRGRVFTQGVESEVAWRPVDRLTATLGYTYLVAKDRDVIDDLEAGRLYRRTDAGRDVRVPTSDYGGLRGRSRHQMTARMTTRMPSLGLSALVQGRVRGRYGFADRNGNGIVDTDAEYAPAYAVVDATLTKTLGDATTLQGGVDNVTGHRDPQHTPAFSGRRWFVSLNARF